MYLCVERWYHREPKSEDKHKGWEGMKISCLKCKSGTLSPGLLLCNFTILNTIVMLVTFNVYLHLKSFFYYHISCGLSNRYLNRSMFKTDVLISTAQPFLVG